MLNGLTLLSLLLCVATVTMCLRNWSQFELFGVVRDGWSGTRRYQANAISISAARKTFALAAMDGDTISPILTQ